MSISKSAVASMVVWSVGFACVAVLVHSQRAPVAPRHPADDATGTSPPRVVAPPASVIEVAPIVVVGQRPPRARPRRAPAATAEEARDVRCGDWRPLVQGYVAQRVRACE